MDIRRMVAAALLTSLILGACSSPDLPPGPSAAESPTPAPVEESDRGAKSASSDDKGSEAKPGKRSERSDEGENGGGGSAPSSSGNDDGSKSGTASGGASQAALVYPSTGRYVYAQSGYEEFCQATCDRADLPAQQPVDVLHRDVSARSATVVSSAQISGSRSTRTTVVFTRDHAFIEELYTRLEYEGFAFSETIEPRPAIDSMRFPLGSAGSWSGRWDDATSGSYAIEVAGTEAVMVGGRSVTAVKIVSSTTLRGRYEGTADLTAWVDPDTNMIVRANGSMDISSSFGKYRSEFETILRSGPGYR